MDMETSEVTALCKDFDRPVSMTFRNVTVTFATDGQGDFGVDLEEMAKGFIMEYEGNYDSHNDLHTTERNTVYL